MSRLEAASGHLGIWLFIGCSPRQGHGIVDGVFNQSTVHCSIRTWYIIIQDSAVKYRDIVEYSTVRYSRI